MPFVLVPMPAVDAAGATAPVCEIWSTASEVSYGRFNGLCYGHDQDLLFGAIQLDEAAAGTASADDGTPLQQAAQSAYQTIFAAVEALGFPHILRFWNYMADINSDSYGMERYRQFNAGRQDGFIQSGRSVIGSAVPAASAVGFASGPLTVYFLAGRDTRSTAIENPRQVSAYQYPPDYGPRSPTFSRASIAHLDQDVLFLSGTASIVGHRTLHAGDVAAQVRETVANIAAMVEQANRSAGQERFKLADLCYKAYVRHPQDIPTVHRTLCDTLGASARILYLQSDICRRDLLVEIEATAGHPLEFSVDAQAAAK